MNSAPTVYVIVGALSSFLGAADDAIHDLPMHAKLGGDLRHWHTVTVRGLHSGVPVLCSGL